MKSRTPIIVTLGGGTGTFVLLSGLKEYPVSLNSVVTMMDSGGSTGRLRDQLGVLPPGDLRQALVALSESKEIWRKLFAYRFDNGDLKGHNFGNLFLSALEKITGSTQDAVQLAMELLKTEGTVYPVTYSNCTLCAKYSDGSVVEGEASIEDALTDVPIAYVFLSPDALINVEAKRILERADYVIFGPGDLYTSIIPNLLVSGMSEVLSSIKAKKIYVSNLMTRYGQTDNFKLSDFVNILESYMGEGLLDYIIVNKTRPSKELLDWYCEVDKSSWVDNDISGDTYRNAKVVSADILSKTKFVQNVADRVKRSFIRHDPQKLAEVIFDLIDNP